MCYWWDCIQSPHKWQIRGTEDENLSVEKCEIRFLIEKLCEDSSTCNDSNIYE
jgi:hypothetical protein